MSSLFLGFIVCFVSYFIVDFLCQKFGLEKLINRKKSIRIILFLAAILINIISASVIENFAARKYQFLLQSFFTGATLYFIVYLLPANNKKIK